MLKLFKIDDKGRAVNEADLLAFLAEVNKVEFPNTPIRITEQGQVQAILNSVYTDLYDCKLYCVMDSDIVSLHLVSASGGFTIINNITKDTYVDKSAKALILTPNNIDTLKQAYALMHDSKLIKPNKDNDGFILKQDGVETYFCDGYISVSDTVINIQCGNFTLTERINDDSSSRFAIEYNTLISNGPYYTIARHLGGVSNAKALVIAIYDDRLRYTIASSEDKCGLFLGETKVPKWDYIVRDIRKDTVVHTVSGYVDLVIKDIYKREQELY